MTVTIQTKTCSTCHEEKPLSAFHRNARRKDGYHNQCRSCRGTKTPRHEGKPTMIRPELKVWRQEFAHVCRCIVCDGTPVLPNTIETVEQAREHLTANAPRCADHLTGTLPLKARIKARQWTAHSADRVAQIDLYHLITVVLKNFRHERRVNGSKERLAGQRDEVTDEMHEFIQHWIERTSDRAVVTHLNETAPIITEDKARTIAWMETSADAMDEARFRALDGEDEDDFNSIMDEVLLTR